MSSFAEIQSKLDRHVARLMNDQSLESFKKFHQFLYKRKSSLSSSHRHHHRNHYQIPASAADSTLSLDTLYYEHNNPERNQDLISFAVGLEDETENKNERTSLTVPTQASRRSSMPSQKGYRTMDDSLRQLSQSQPTTTTNAFTPPVYEAQLSPNQSKALLSILINYCGSTKVVQPKVHVIVNDDDEGSNRDHKVLEERAILALEIFCFLTVNDKEFQYNVEHLNIEAIRRLKLRRHIQQGTDEHKKICSRLVKFLSTHFHRLGDWKEFVSEEGHEEMEIQINQLENIVDLTKNFFDTDHLPPSGSYHNVSSHVIPVIFKTSISDGLSSAEIEHRRYVYGTNELPKPRRRSVILMLVHQIIDFMVLLLIAAAIVSIGLRDYAAGVVLLIVVAFNVLVGFTQDWKAERALSSLLSITVQKATVVRDGKTMEIKATELVPGDIVSLEEGIQIPADIHLVEAHDLSAIESLLTGESLPVEKNTNTINKKSIAVGDKTNMAFMSTYVAKGRGKGVVVATGKQTEIGKISESLVNTKTKPTRLQQHLKHLGLMLVGISVLVCVIVTAIGFARKFDYLEMVKTGVSLAVSVIPEGLVAVTTFTMALSVQRMAKKHVIVRKMPSVETLGSVTCICCDKTGTVTEGKMEMTHLCPGNETIKVNSDGSLVLQGTETKVDPNSEPLVCCMMRVAALCNNAVIEEKDPGKKKFNERYEVTGDPTETAIMVVAFKTGYGKRVWIDEKHCHFEEEIAFDSERKTMTVIYSQREGSQQSKNRTLILTKGAPESVLMLCSSIMDKNGECRELDKKTRSSLHDKSLQMAKRGLRVLAFAQRDEKYNEELNIADCEKDLTFLGFVALLDPPRASVAKSIKICRRAGIRVFMITGDHASTGRYVAEALHIIAPGAENAVLEGKDIDRLVATNTLHTLDPFPQVFARVSPENKIQIVEALQKQGEVVAMIGDGINDAGSIKRSDVGVAMGMNSTDVAKEAATIVLADNNFSSIVEAIREGRHTFDNIKIFVLYLLSCNLGELMIMFFAIASYTPIPFSPIQILWANLIADTPPALSLGVEPVDKHALRRLPRSPKQGLFTYKGWIIMLYQSVVMTVIALSGFVVSYYVERYTLMHCRSFTFVLLISVQLVHAFHSRSITKSIFSMKLLGNKWLVWATLLSFALVVLGIYTPKLNTLLDFVPLDHWDWFKVIIGCVIHSFLVEISKVPIRRYSRDKSHGRKFYVDM